MFLYAHGFAVILKNLLVKFSIFVLYQLRFLVHSYKQWGGHIHLETSSYEMIMVESSPFDVKYDITESFQNLNLYVLCSVYKEKWSR